MAALAFALTVSVVLLAPASATASHDALAYAAASDPNGGFVAAGVAGASSSTRDFALARYGDNGILDSSFGEGGRVRYTVDANTEARTEEARAVVVQPDGRVLAAGHSNVTGNKDDYAIVRYTREGVSDGSFGVNGAVTIDFVKNSDHAQALALQSDGKILVAGGASYNATTAIARLNVDGSLDDGGPDDLTPEDSFGVAGKVKIDVAQYRSERANAILAQPDGRILIGGYSQDPADSSYPYNNDFTLLRLLADGSPDPAFGVGGVVTTDLAGENERITAMALQRDGRIVVGGWTQSGPGDKDSVVARYNTDGSLDDGGIFDPTPLDEFGVDGKVIKGLGVDAGASADDEITSLALRADGRLVLGGYAETTAQLCPDGGTSCANMAEEAFSTFGLLSDGADDPSYGPQSRMMPCVKNRTYCPARGQGVIPQADGGVYVAGWAYGNSSLDRGFAVLRFAGSGGTISSPPAYWDAGVPTDSTSSTAPNPGYVSLPANNGLDRNGNDSATGDPVSAVTGNLTSYQQDLLLQAPGISTQMVRFYNSSEAAVDGPIGRGWTFTYGASLKEAANGDVLFREPDGAQRIFIRQTDGSFKSPAGNFDVLSTETGGVFRLRRHNGITWRFDAAGKLISLTDLNANTLTLTYASGRLTGLTDPAGHQVTFAYDTGGRISEMTAPGVDSADRSVTYTYNASGELTSVTDLAGSVTTYGYNAKHELTTIDTPGDSTHPGTTRTFIYESATGRVASQAEAGGVNKLEYTYEPENARTLIKDSKANQSIYYYDPRGQVTRVVDPYGKELRSGWNAAGNKTKTTDQILNATDLTYDGFGNTTQVKAPAPTPASTTRPTTDYTYGANGRPVAITNEDGTTSFGYDGSGNLTLLRDARNKDTTFTVNSRGQVLTKTTALQQASGTPTKYRYNSNGTLAEAEDASSRITTFSYDAAGRVTTVTLPGGRSTDYEYDAADRVTKVTLPAATTGAPRGTLQTTYDPRGNAIAAKDENGHWSYRTYDEHARLISTVDATNRETTYAYDTESNLTDTTAPSGVVTHLTYDNIRRLQTSTVGYGTSSALTTEYDYFDTGQLKRRIDPKARITAYAYDTLGRLMSTTEGSGTSDEATTSYEYTATGDLSKVTNPNGHWTSYEYWPTGQMKTKKVESSDPANPFTWSWTLDADGQILSRTDAEGAVTTYSYDANGEVLGIDEPTGTPDVSHTYAAVTGDRASTTDGTGTTSYAYDGLARLTQEDLPGGRVRKQGFDLAGNRTRLELPGSDVRRFTYDDADRLTKVYDGSAADTAARETAYVYDTAGRLSTATHAATGASRSYSYDTLERLSSVTNRATDNSIIAKRDYGYDAASNTTSITDENSVQATYTYDALDRLKSELSAGTEPVGRTLDLLKSELAVGAEPIDRAYTYDPAGNRKTLVEDSTTTTYAYDTAERLTGDGTNTNSWNRNGELVSKTAGGLNTTYGWDGEGRITAIDLPGTTSDETFAYDAGGRRVSSTTGTSGSAVTTTSLFDGSDVAQQQAASGPLTRYVRGLDDELLSMEAKATGTGTGEGAFNGDSASLRYFHLDAQKSVVALSNGSGQGSDNYAYTAFGDLNDSSGATPNPFGYLSNEADPAAKIHNFHARSYAAADGRFLSRDPDAGDVALPQSLNPYVYGANNPFAHPDPYGASWLGDTGIGMGISNSVAWGLSAPFRLAGVEQEDIAGGYLRVGEVLPVSRQTQYYLAASGTKAGVDWTYLIAMGVLDAGTGGRGSSAIAFGRTGDKGLRWFAAVRRVARSEDGRAAIGRGGRQARLRALGSDDKVASHLRGWTKQEQKQVSAGSPSGRSGKTLRLPPGYVLAHRRKFEARKGFDYGHSDLNDINLHKLQHRFEGYR